MNIMVIPGERFKSNNARLQGQSPSEAADSLWQSMEVLQGHDADASSEFGVSSMLPDADVTGAVVGVSVGAAGVRETQMGPGNNLAAIYPFFIKVLEGRRLYDLMDTLVHSKRHTPLRWACLAALGGSSWIERVRLPLLSRTPVLWEIVASLQFYADAGHQNDATNPFIFLASKAAAETLQQLFLHGGGPTGEELSRLLDLGVLPALAAWSTTCVSGRDAAAAELPGCEPHFDALRMLERADNGSTAPIVIGGVSLRWVMHILSVVAEPVGRRMHLPPDQILAALVATLKPLQGMIKDVTTAGVPAEEHRERALWYLTNRWSGHADLQAFMQSVCTVLAQFLRPDSLRLLPQTLKADAIEAVEELGRLGLCPKPRAAGAVAVRAALQGGGSTGLGDIRAAAASETSDMLLDFKRKERAAQSCSRPGCGRHPTAVAGARGKAAEFKQCMRCKVAAYCSRECQVEHWSNRHKKICPKGLDITAGTDAASGTTA